MIKGMGAQPSQAQGAGQRSRRKQGDVATPTHDFVRAFADALRDILREERRRMA